LENLKIRREGKKLPASSTTTSQRGKKATRGKPPLQKEEVPRASPNQGVKILEQDVLGTEPASGRIPNQR